MSESRELNFGFSFPVVSVGLGLSTLSPRGWFDVEGVVCPPVGWVSQCRLEGHCCVGVVVIALSPRGNGCTFCCVFLLFEIVGYAVLSDLLCELLQMPAVWPSGTFLGSQLPVHDALDLLIHLDITKMRAKGSKKTHTESRMAWHVCTAVTGRKCYRMTVSEFEHLRSAYEHTRSIP